MVMIFSLDPSSNIIFLHVVLGGGVGGGGGLCLPHFRSFLDTLSGQYVAKLPCRETTLSGNYR